MAQLKQLNLSVYIFGKDKSEATYVAMKALQHLKEVRELVASKSRSTQWAYVARDSLRLRRCSKAGEECFYLNDQCIITSG